MITKLDAVCLLVENLEVSQDFYQNKLGLTIKSTDTGFVEFELGETPLAIFEKKHATAMFPIQYMQSTGGAVTALRVDDITKTCAELDSKGVHIFEGPKQTSWGQTVAYLHNALSANQLKL
jgi:catechol 2,3-dioxygenase-like lactoylglutathione lyase family enzyme